MTVNGGNFLLKRNKVNGYLLNENRTSYTPIQPITYETEKGEKWEYHPEEGYLPLPTCSDLTNFRKCFRSVKLNPTLIKILEELSKGFYTKEKGVLWWEKKVGCYYSTLASKLWCHPRTISRQLNKVLDVQEKCPICGMSFVLLEMVQRRNYSPTNRSGNQWDIFNPGYIHYIAHLRKHKTQIGEKNFNDIVKTSNA